MYHWALHAPSTVSLPICAKSARRAEVLDQNKIAFLQRKPVFSVRLLVIGAPHHSKDLRGVAEKMSEEDL